MLQTIGYHTHKPTKGRISSRDKYIKNNLTKDVRKTLNLHTKLDGGGIENSSYLQT